MPVLNNSFFCGYSGSGGEVVYYVDYKKITYDGENVIIDDSELLNKLLQYTDAKYLLVSFYLDGSATMGDTTMRMVLAEKNILNIDGNLTYQNDALIQVSVKYFRVEINNNSQLIKVMLKIDNSSTNVQIENGIYILPQFYTESLSSAEGVGIDVSKAIQFIWVY